jgi:hypothetical protein
MTKGKRQTRHREHFKPEASRGESEPSVGEDFSAQSSKALKS